MDHESDADPHSMYSEDEADGSTAEDTSEHDKHSSEHDKHNSDWDSRLELLRVCSSNGKFLTKKARAPPIGGKWVSEEDEHLRDIVRVHGAENWRKVASLLGPTRTDVQCLHRWNKVLRPGLQKGAWSIDEDRLVRDAVQYQALNGVGRILWSEIAAQLPGRLGKQCRERYFNHLDPSINKGDWTPPEDRILFEGQKQFGNRWCEISKVLPGRTENSVKNRWNSSAMRRWLKENNLSAGSGAPLNDIAAIEDLHRALAAFSDALAVCGISISKETAATLLSDMTSISVDDSNAVKEKAKKDKVKKKKEMADMAAEVLAAADSVRAISRSNSADVLDAVCDSGSRGARDGTQGMDLREGDINRCPSGQTGAVRRDSTNGMSLPSHLRPPLIVTVASQRPSGSATGTSEDHELLELLSNMKSSPKWEPSPVKSFSSERKRAQENDGRGEGEKRIKMESIAAIPRRKKSVDIGTPTDRALKRVRLELARREKESSNRKEEACDDDDLTIDYSAGCHDDGIVPFDLLPFFKYLADSTQSLLMAQLVDHFQQTSYTPRNFNALLPTPRLPNDTGGAYAYGYNGITHTLTLCSPRGELSHSNRPPASYSFDPKCFEKDFSATGREGEEDDPKSNNSNIMGNVGGNNGGNMGSIGGMGGNIGVMGVANGMCNGMKSDALQSYLNAPINAAVNVALKCATRETSFEEVLSWLQEAPDLYADTPRAGPRRDEAGMRVHATIPEPAHISQVNLMLPPVPVKRNGSPGGGMMLPSHLRPPLIVTANSLSQGQGQGENTSRPPSGCGTSTSTTSSEDHKMVVELLSNLKTSPKWGQDLLITPSSTVENSPHPRTMTGSGGGSGGMNGSGGGSGGSGSFGGMPGVMSVRGKRKNADEYTADDSGHSVRALKRVRLELALLEKENREKKESMGMAGEVDGKSAVIVDTDSSIVPFQLLPFFKYLDDHAQRCLMRQLVDHFQQTSYTPRNFNALLPTPRFSHRSSNLPTEAADYIDPNCFEEGAVTFTSFTDDPAPNGEQRRRSFAIKEADGIATFRSRSGSQEDSIARMDSCSTDDVQAYLDAPINAAVNVALKCATREASFEEVLSWLIGASSHQSGYEYSPPPDREGCSNSFYPSEVLMLSTAWNLT